MFFLQGKVSYKVKTFKTSHLGCELIICFVGSLLVYNCKKNWQNICF
ncbi:hypothetical protein M33023_02370 [Candidatus Phytoplasma asteris]|uniref:Transposase n=1 Tax=Candidatus Phytoplasma asteris TaxID=85620 RepID=A0ABZ2YET9_9MOLU